MTQVLDLSAYRLGTDEDARRLTRLPLNTTAIKTIRGTDLYQQAQAMQDAIVDMYVSAGSLYVYVSDAESGNSMFSPKLFVRGAEYWITNTAFSQLCEKSGMGVTSYMKKCLAQSYQIASLVSENLNRWLGLQGDKKIMVRVCGDTVIAVLSDKYGVFDHGDALDCLNKALGSSGQYQIEAHSLTVDTLSLRLVDTEKVVLHDASQGRDLSTAGMLYRNGQTGLSVASVEFMIYTFACTNGLIVSEDRGVVYRRKHISIDKEDFTRQIAATLEQFPAYVAEARKDMEQARLRRLQVDEQVRLRAHLKTSLGVGEETVSEIFDVMEERWDTNAWGIAGAITEVAQKFSVTRQYQFEKYAGELVRKLMLHAA